MGLYIPDLRLPADGDFELWIAVRKDGSFTYNVRGGWQDGKQRAVPVTPHGDLIDHNALKIAVMDCDAETRIDFLKHAMDCINKAPVVIPSDMPSFEAEEGET